MSKIFLILSIIISISLFAEAGVIIPKGMDGPNKDFLTLNKMRIDIKIEGQYANVKIMQIFKNHKSWQQEGEYVFVMPDDAMISNFAIWEDGKRIKGVIMERKKARALYEKIKARMVDPGLLEKKDNISLNKFTVNIFPIPGNGYKRVEIQYTELLPTNFLTTRFNLSLKPLIYKNFIVDVEEFELHFDMKNALNIDSLSWESPFNINLDSPNEFFTNVKKDKKNISFSFSKKNMILNEDFSLNLVYKLDKTTFNIFTYRDIEKERIDYSPTNNGKKYKDKTGFFLGELFLKMKAQNKNDLAKKTVIVFDHSLSMRWLKLTQAVEVLKSVLSNLNKDDNFDVVLWNNKAESLFNSKLENATQNNKDKALEKVLSLQVLNGTDISKLAKFLKSYPKGTQIYWITDGQATLGNINSNSLLKNMLSSLGKLNFFILGIGNDTNKKFLSSLASATKGYYLHFYENENSKPKMELFKKAINQKPIKNLDYSFSNSDNFQDIYTLSSKDNVYDESSFFLVGKYKNESKIDLDLSYKNIDGKTENYKFNLDFPKKAIVYSFVKRVWAKARINYLLYQINENGEKKEWINEIIALSKEFTLVTPYTSFLAAPRSLIRPRSIIPGDPVLRVKTDSEINSVVAKFEFGLTQKLIYLPNKDIWETRFLAPADLKDGDYSVKLFLRSKDGETLIEEKSITIDSTPPKMNVKYIDNGSTIKIIVNASKDSKKIYAFSDKLLVPIKYDSNEKASIGYINKSRINKGDELKFILEDFAHNTSTIYSNVNF